MLSKTVYESFKNAFNAFCVDLNYKKYNGGYFKTADEMFFGILPIYKNYNDTIYFDIIVSVFPLFCVQQSDIDLYIRSGFSLNRFAEYYNIKLSDISDENGLSLSGISPDFFSTVKKICDSYFSAISVRDYYTKAIDCGKKISGSDGLSKNQNNPYYEVLPYIDFMGAAFDFYKHGLTKKCSSFVAGILGQYRSYLYEKMKYGNPEEFDDKYYNGDKDIIKIVFKRYNDMTCFAEALIEENKEYFINLEKTFIQNKIKNEKYLHNF